MFLIDMLQCLLARTLSLGTDKKEYSSPRKGGQANSRWYGSRMKIKMPAIIAIPL